MDVGVGHVHPLDADAVEVGRKYRRVYRREIGDGGLARVDQPDQQLPQVETDRLRRVEAPVDHHERVRVVGRDQ